MLNLLGRGIDSIRKVGGGAITSLVRQKALNLKQDGSTKQHADNGDTHHDDTLSLDGGSLGCSGG